jgi:hypothetical protein
MTIDERLEKLTERHEALTLSVELMSTENRERDVRMDKMIAVDKRRRCGASGADRRESRAPNRPTGRLTTTQPREA